MDFKVFQPWKFEYECNYEWDIYVKITNIIVIP